MGRPGEANGRPNVGGQKERCWVSLLHEPANAEDRPIGVILWAFADDEVESRLLSGNARLRPQGWKSGDRPWIVEACPGPQSGTVAPFGGTDEMLKDLKAKMFEDREVRFRAVERARGVAGVL